MTDRHAIIRIAVDNERMPTARARCSCGSWRQAGSFGSYPGRPGAILLVTQRFDCGTGPLPPGRLERPFPQDAESVGHAAGELDRKAEALREQAAQLLRQAADYELAAGRLHEDRAALSEEPRPA